MSDIVNKNGRWTKAEEDYMKDNYGIMPINEMARILRRNPVTVRRYVTKNCDMPFQKANTLSFNIKRTPIWDEISEQLTEDEQPAFLYHWNNIVTQFQNDVFATERMQIIDICRNEILMNRILKKMKDSAELSNTLDQKIQKEKEKPELKRDEDKITNLEVTKATLMASSQALQKEYKDLMDSKKSMLKEIKGTRDQRIARVENSKESLLTWISTLLLDNDMRRKIGIEVEKFRLATEVELVRLSDYYEYMDKEIEQPILTHETVKDDNF